MGIDVGFDLFPPLEGEDDSIKWDLFLKEIETKYAEDPIFEAKEGTLEFKVGEHPSLTKNPASFRRFSSKVSGSCWRAKRYIDEVYDASRSYFDKRVYYWSYYGFEDEPSPVYSWGEVSVPSDLSG